MKKYFLFLFSFILIASGILNAQNRKKPVVFSLLAGVPLPAGDFASTDGENAGFAGIGAGGTFEFSILVYSPGISWITSVSYFYNSVKKEDLKTFAANGAVEEYSSGTWNNVPILTGLKIYGPFFGPELILTLQGGVNIAGPPDISFKYNETKLNADYGKKISFAYSFGATFNFDNFLLGARYMALGSPKLKWNTTAEGLPDFGSHAMNISPIYVYMGFNL